MINLLVETAHKTKTYMSQIFKDAYDYNEIRKLPEEILLDYEEALFKDQLPQFVVDYCLELLSPNGLATEGLNEN